VFLKWFLISCAVHLMKVVLVICPNLLRASRVSGVIGHRVICLLCPTVFCPFALRALMLSLY